jgi:hypothetical protein
MDRAVKRAEPWGIVIAVVLLFLSLLTYCSDQSGRVEQRTVEAWQLLLHTAPGNSGKREALEYLNKEDGLICIKGNCWPQWKGRAELVGVKLGAYYGEDEDGNLQGGVFLREVQLPSAKLAGANFAGAILDGANLSGADLSGAILDRASLTGADLSGAILTGVDGLTQEQLDEACGDASTSLPDGLTISPCQ